MQHCVLKFNALLHGIGSAIQYIVFCIMCIILQHVLERQLPVRCVGL